MPWFTIMTVIVVFGSFGLIGQVPDPYSKKAAKQITKICLSKQILLDYVCL